MISNFLLRLLRIISPFIIPRSKSLRANPSRFLFYLFIFFLFAGKRAYEKHQPCFIIHPIPARNYARRANRLISPPSFSLASRSRGGEKKGERRREGRGGGEKKTRRFITNLCDRHRIVVVNNALFVYYHRYYRYCRWYNVAFAHRRKMT